MSVDKPLNKVSIVIKPSLNFPVLAMSIWLLLLKYPTSSTEYQINVLYKCILQANKCTGFGDILCMELIGGKRLSIGKRWEKGDSISFLAHLKIKNIIITTLFEI